MYGKNTYKIMILILQYSLSSKYLYFRGSEKGQINGKNGKFGHFNRIKAFTLWFNPHF